MLVSLAFSFRGEYFSTCCDGESSGELLSQPSCWQRFASVSLKGVKGGADSASAAG